MLTKNTALLVVISVLILASGPAWSQQRTRICSTGEVLRSNLRRHGLRPSRLQSASAPRGTLGTGLLPVAPIRGTVRALHVIVRFPQDADSLPPHTNAFYQQLLWDASNPFSMTSFWRENSFGQLNLTGDTVGPIIFGATPTRPLGVLRGALSAGATVANFTDSVVKDAGKTALTQIVQQISSEVDFSRYDSDRDGRVDLMIVTFPILNTATAALQSNPVGAAYFLDPLALTAFRLSLPQNRALGVPAPFTDPIQTPNGVVVDQWIFQGEDFSFLGTSSNVASSPQNGATVYAHETGHCFGLPDFIDESRQIPQSSAGSGLFDGMALGNRNMPDRLNGLTTNGFNPNSFLGGIVHTTAWGKFALGWLTPTNVTGTLTNQTLRPIEQFPDCLKLNVNGDASAREYFLIENRQSVPLSPTFRNVFDAGLVGTRITPAAGVASPGTGLTQQPIHGLLVWHIDENVIQNTILTNQPASDPNFPGIKLVQADGRDDMFRPLPTVFGQFGAVFNLLSFGFDGFTPTGNDGDNSDPFPGTRNTVHIGDGSDGKALLIDNTGLTPPTPSGVRETSTQSFAGTQSGVVIDNIRENPRAAGGFDIVANVTALALAQLNTSSITIVNPLSGDRLENFTPTIAAIYSTTHPGGLAANSLTTTTLNLTIADGTGADVPYVTNGVAVSVPGAGLGTLTVTPDGTITFQPPLLTGGAHTVKITANNALGQTVTATPVTFILAQRRLRAGLTMLSFPYRFTSLLADGTELQPNSPLSLFRFSDLAAGGPQTLLGTQNPVFGRFDLGRFGGILSVTSSFTTPYHVFTPGRSIVNLDPYIDVVFPGLAYWARIDPLGVLLQLRARNIPTTMNFRVIHEDSDASGTLPVFDLSRGQLTYARPSGATIGWRMVGNPFPFPISYSNIQIKFQGQTLTVEQALTNNPQLLSPAFFRFDFSLGAGGGYTMDTAPNGTLNPFEGVWINFLQPVQVEITPVRSAGSRTLHAAALPSTDASNWLIGLAARADSYQDDHNYLGVRTDAQDGLDSRDIPKPPDYPGNHLRLNILGSAGSEVRGNRSVVRLMQDVRKGPLTSAQSYDFEVETDLQNADITVTWDSTAKVPSRHRLTLVDLESGRRLYMRTTSAFTYNSGHGGRHLFRVEVEAQPGPTMRVQHILTSQVADGSVRISYSLTQSAAVQLRVVNSAGKVVRRLANAQGGRGLNQAGWDGRDDAGRRVPRGIYVIQIVADTDEQQTGQGLASVTLK